MFYVLEMPGTKRKLEFCGEETGVAQATAKVQPASATAAKSQETAATAEVERREINDSAGTAEVELDTAIVVDKTVGLEKETASALTTPTVMPAEFEPADLVMPGENITVHGILIDLSPLKSGRNAPFTKYFTGRISDGKKSLRFVSFDAKMRSEMEKYHQEPLAIANCNIKTSKFSGSGLDNRKPKKNYCFKIV